MTYRQFKEMFDEILTINPLPNGDRWCFQQLGNTSLRNKGDWMEILYRTRANYDCKHGHHWQSVWTMILFRFDLDRRTHVGRVRMKRFGQRCNKKECKDDETYHTGFCPEYEVWRLVQCLLLYILQRFYEGRSHYDTDDLYYILPMDNVGSGGSRRHGGPSHSKDCCEACAYNLCQDKFKHLTKNT